MVFLFCILIVAAGVPGEAEPFLCAGSSRADESVSPLVRAAKKASKVTGGNRSALIVFTGFCADLTGC